MKYKVSFPATDWMSQISYIVTETLMETKEDQALWYYNDSRQHDGLRKLNYLPKGTVFTPVNEN